MTYYALGWGLLIHHNVQKEQHLGNGGMGWW